MYNIEHTTIVSDIEQGYCAEQGRLVGHILTGKTLDIMIKRKKKKK